MSELYSYLWEQIRTKATSWVAVIQQHESRCQICLPDVVVKLCSQYTGWQMLPQDQNLIRFSMSILYHLWTSALQLQRPASLVDNKGATHISVKTSVTSTSAYTGNWKWIKCLTTRSYDEIQHLDTKIILIKVEVLCIPVWEGLSPFPVCSIIMHYETLKLYAE